MSDNYSEANISAAFSEGHNDAWNKQLPKQVPIGVLTDRRHQSYRKGYALGTNARYYYDAGYKAAQSDVN